MHKILFVNISTELGGAESSLLTYLEEMKKHFDGEIKMLFPKKKGPLIEKTKNLDIDFDFLTMPIPLLKTSRSSYFISLIFILASLPFFIIYIFQLVRYIKKAKFTHIYSTGIKNHLLLGYLCFFLNFKLCIHVRDNLDSIFLKILLMPIYKNKKIIWISNSVHTQKSLLPIKSKVIYNGFDLNVDSKKHHKFQKELKIPLESKLIGHVAVLSEWKGQFEFIKMAQRLVNYTDQVYFLIFGAPIYDTFRDQRYFDHLLDAIKDNSLQNRIFMMGFRDNNEIMNGIDLLVHTSTKPEPFGRVLVEAMLHKVPVIAAPEGGPKEIIDHRYSGYLISPHNTAELSETAHLLISNNALIKKITTNALKSCENLFSVKKNSLELTEQIFR